ncbi:uncharacterized protein LOC115402286 [Salarias fasciatus]|uniref:uncharacterized protein LOC115402286 n=1 Tax=Salarias fasciatus TaxID=181472 RepID=UPI0011770603|nr:uncharacterized protein LOC115402286 [Salarias fasciatus]
MTEEENEERPKSNISVKSGISVKSDISTKSKSSDFKVEKGGDACEEVNDEEQCTDEGAVEYEPQERAQSAVSTKTAKSSISTKSAKSGLDCRVEHPTFDHEEPEDRAPSNLSLKSNKSQKSNISVVSKKSKVSVSEFDPSDEIASREEQIESRSVSSMSVSSIKSERSNRSKCSADVHVEERPQSHASTISIKSDASKCASDGRNEQAESQDRMESPVSDERYKELMNILQSLWLCEPPKHEYTLKDDHHSVDDDFNHTSSSGVDVNSGSTGSGKSSDGVKKTSRFR